MAFRDLLLQLSNYPEATNLQAVESATEFAKIVGARITALTFEMDMHVPWNATGNMIVNISGMVAAERAKSAANAKEILKIFGVEAAKRDLVHDHKIECCLTALIPGFATEYARMRDLNHSGRRWLQPAARRC